MGVDLSRRFKALGRALATVWLLIGLAACAIDPVPTPGQGDTPGAVDKGDAFNATDARPATPDAATGGCSCFDDQGQEWHCDPGADACPCEPSTLVCPDADACEGVEVPDVVEPVEVLEP